MKFYHKESELAAELFLHHIPEQSLLLLADINSATLDIQVKKNYFNKFPELMGWDGSRLGWADGVLRATHGQDVVTEVQIAPQSEEEYEADVRQVRENLKTLLGRYRTLSEEINSIDGAALMATIEERPRNLSCVPFSSCLSAEQFSQLQIFLQKAKTARLWKHEAFGQHYLMAWTAGHKLRQGRKSIWETSPDRRQRMEEAKALGEEIEETNEAKEKVQQAMAALNEKLREAQEQAAVGDTVAAQRAGTLEQLLEKEAPRLTQLFDEKRQRYELDFARLRELKREISHLEHAEKKLETTVQAEFQHWRQAVAKRYPEAPKEELKSRADKNVDDRDLAETEERAAPAEPAVAPPCQLDDQVAKEAQDAGDEPRRRLLAQLLAQEEPRLAKLKQRG
eukprot:g8848.t1